MAHEITIRQDNTAEFAFTGSREKIWHGLGAELQVGASIEEWKTAAGMDWEVFESGITYQSMNGAHSFPDKVALFRSDTKDALSIVSADYKVVQPSEVLEFFRDLVELHDMQLSAAGTLFGGKRFWATAELGKEFEVVTGDAIKGQLLLVTSVDGTLSTQARFTSVRTVCNNTLTMALGDSSKRAVKKSHHTVFDPKEVKIDLGLIDTSWNTFMMNMKALADVKVTDEQARAFYQKHFYTPDVEADKQSWGPVREVNRLMNWYTNGAGSQYSYGTAYGVLQGVTEHFTHGSGKRDPSHQMWESYFGKSDSIKSKIYDDLMALV